MDVSKEGHAAERQPGQPAKPETSSMLVDKPCQTTGLETPETLPAVKDASNNESVKPAEDCPEEGLGSVETEGLNRVLQLMPPVKRYRPYRFSDRVRRDRHIFLKGANAGVGCGPSDVAADGSPPAVHQSYTCGKSSQRKGSWSDTEPPFTHRDLFQKSQIREQDDMEMDSELHPSGRHKQLSLPRVTCTRHSDDQSVLHLKQKRYRPHHQPVTYRPLNETLKPYVFSQKRQHSAEDQHGDATSSFVFPSLSAPTVTPTTTPRRQKPSPRSSAETRHAVPQVPAFPPVLSRRATTLSVPQRAGAVTSPLQTDTPGSRRVFDPPATVPVLKITHGTSGKSTITLGQSHSEIHLETFRVRPAQDVGTKNGVSDRKKGYPVPREGRGLAPVYLDKLRRQRTE